MTLPGHSIAVTPENNQLRVVVTRISDSKVVYNNLIRDPSILYQGTSGATAANQLLEIGVLESLVSAVQAVGVDRYANISYYLALTPLGGEATVGDSIERARVYDTSTSEVISTIWTNEDTGLVLTQPPVIGVDVELLGSSALTAPELQAMQLASQATLGEVNTKLEDSAGTSAGINLFNILTELQLKANLTDTQPVGATGRVCVSQQPITVPITTGASLASLCSGGIIPVGAVTCEIQALNAPIRYTLDGSTVTPTTGMRLNVDDKLVIDSALTSVRIVAESGAATCSVALFDRV